MPRLLLLLFWISLTHLSIAQDTHPVQIRILNGKKEAVAYASIRAVNLGDTLLHFRAITDSNGVAGFSMPYGQYRVFVSAVNYRSLEKNLLFSARTSGEIVYTAEPAARDLDAVVVTAKKPLMRQEDDKTIVDPENLVAASTSGYEVIEKTPGLFVDQDGNIYISSLSPATVQINGRDMRMSAADVATLLKSLPPGAISRIEIVRTPSARYDANSSGGVVNVVLKKGVRIGVTGSVTAGMQQGTYGNQFAGFNLNNNDGVRTSFINLNYNRRTTYEKIVTDRLFAADSLLGQTAFTRYPAEAWFAGLGHVFPAGRKWELDVGTSVSLNRYDNQTDNRSGIRKLSTGQPLSDNLNHIENEGYTLNYRAGLEGKKKLDTLGSEWNNDVFYNFTRNRTDQLYGSTFFLPASFFLQGDGDIANDRHVLGWQTDLKWKTPKRLTVEAGAKSSFLQFNSSTAFFREAGGNREKDAARTNQFRYRENINALYLQGSQTLGKDLVIKAGVRLENTHMEGRQLIPADTNFTIRRTDLFPFVYLSRNLLKIAGYDLRAYLIYRRSIARPVYEQLNPFSRYIDQYLSETGNPSLRPQFTQNYEANVSVDERPILAVGVNDTKDIFTSVIYQADSSRQQAFRTVDNLGTNREWYFRGLAALPPGGRYFFVIGTQYNHNTYEGLYENKPLSFRRGTWTFFTYQTFRIDKKSVFTLNGFWRLKGQQQFYELGSFGALNLSVNRKFARDKWVVTLSLSDVFATNRNDFFIAQGTVRADGFRQADTRRVGLNLRYNFGFRKKEEKNNLFDADPPVNN